MPNYTLVADTTFKNRSFDDLIRPFQMYTEVYNQMADSINELDTKASVWEGMANEQSDPVAYAQYKRYADELRTQAKLIATNGTSPSTRQDVLNLRRRYASEIAPIENAYTTRKEQAAEQRKALNADPTLLLSRRADATSLDDYLANPTLGYESYSGAVLASQVGNAAKALAKELKNYGNGKRLDAYTKTWIEQHGFTADEVAHAINNPDDPKSSKVLRTLVDNVMADSGIHRWADYPTLSQAYNYARQGLWEAVGVDNVHQYEDYGARLREQIRQQKKAAEDAKKEALSRVYHRRNVYTTKELGENAKHLEQWNKFKDYFSQDDKGNWYINELGEKAFKGIPITGPDGYYKMQSPTEFKDFIISYIGNNADKNLVNNRISELYNRANNIYDANRATEYYASLSHADYNTVMSVLAQVSNNGDLFIAERTKDDKDNYKIVSGAKSIELKDKSASDIQMAQIVYGKHGNYLAVKMKGEEDEILVPLNQIDSQYNDLVNGSLGVVEKIEEDIKNGITHYPINGEAVPAELVLQQVLNNGARNFITGFAPVQTEATKIAPNPATLLGTY